MCLLVLIHKSVPDYPLIILANRDEDPARGGELPHPWPEGILAPRDPRSGGTWIGVNSHGVFSAVTNRVGPPAGGPQVKSRGTLPLEALKEKTAILAHQRAARIPTFLYSPFNWIYADVEQAFAVEHGGPSDLTVRLRPGLHVLSNEHDLSLETAAAVSGFLKMDPQASDIEEIFSRLKILAGLHKPLLSDNHRICKHEPADKPRTLSASIVALHAKDPSRRRWLYHDGPPCKDKWTDVPDFFRG